jgi:predicted nucleic acid-binding protein
MTAEVFVDTKLSFWDAAILAAAKKMGCRVVFSEDLNDGQD